MLVLLVLRETLVFVFVFDLEAGVGAGELVVSLEEVAANVTGVLFFGVSTASCASTVPPSENEVRITPRDAGPRKRLKPNRDEVVFNMVRSLCDECIDDKKIMI